MKDEDEIAKDQDDLLKEVRVAFLMPTNKDLMRYGAFMRRVEYPVLVASTDGTLIEMFRADAADVAVIDAAFVRNPAALIEQLQDEAIVGNREPGIVLLFDRTKVPESTLKAAQAAGVDRIVEMPAKAHAVGYAARVAAEAALRREYMPNQETKV